MTGETFEFECPSCGAAMRVDDPMKQVLVEEGCVFCDAPLTAAAFSPR